MTDYLGLLDFMQWFCKVSVFTCLIILCWSLCIVLLKLLYWAWIGVEIEDKVTIND